jgi:hypothetical protein
MDEVLDGPYESFIEHVRGESLTVRSDLGAVEGT